jgi:antitoxin component HigA of HigAB toxin-antitoxin module
MFLKPLKNIIEEMNKCELLCKNCHAKEHFDTNRFLKFKKEIFNKVNSYVEHSPVNWDIVKTMHKQGIKKADISREIGCSKGLITHILKKGKIK